MIASLGAYAGSREDILKERAAKQKRIEEAQMIDLGIDSPPVIDRNAIGAIGHHVERSAEKQFTIYSYPKYFFGNDGKLQLSDVKLRPSEKNGVAYEMEDAVYRFYACPDGSYWVFHYGMWMYFYIKDIAYMDRSDGMLHSLGWKHLSTEPKVEERKIEWLEIFPGVGLKIELSEDFVKESILLTDAARANLPNPKELGLSPENTDIVLVYDFVRDDLCDDYKFPDYDLSESYEMADNQGVRAKSDNFAIDGELTFSRKGIVRHKFLRDEALLPGFVDRDTTPELRAEVKKYLQNTKDGGTLLAYGIPYLVQCNAGKGTIDIDPTIQFQEGISSYSGTYATQIRGESGYMNYNYGRDTMLKVGDYNGTPWRSLVKFDLSSISKLTTNCVTSAYLKLKFMSYLGTLVSRNAYVYQIKRAWNEGNSAQGETPQTGEATWNQSKYNVDSWGTAGCDNTTSDRNSTADSYASLSTYVGNWNEWDITNSVKSWLSNNLSNNYGVLIKPGWTNTYPEFAHYSDNWSPEAAYRPQLVINLSCDYSGPASDLGYEYLGNEELLNDGIVFKNTSEIQTTTWDSGDPIYMDWTLKTTHDYTQYGGGQFLRMWIDIDKDCIFEETEEVILLKNINPYPSRPYVQASNGYAELCETNVGCLAGTFTVPYPDQDATFPFRYRFIVPTVLESKQTTARIILRYWGWPNDDPTKTLYQIDDDGGLGGLECGTQWGDYEDYSITINP